MFMLQAVDWMGVYMRRTERYSAVYCVEHFLSDILHVIREGESNYYTLLIFNIPLRENKRAWAT